VDISVGEMGRASVVVDIFFPRSGENDFFFRGISDGGGLAREMGDAIERRLFCIFMGHGWGVRVEKMAIGYQICPLGEKNTRLIQLHGETRAALTGLPKVP